MGHGFLIQTLKGLERTTGLPYAQKKVVSTIYNLIRKYSFLDNDLALGIIFDQIANGNVEKLYNGRTDGNLSICIYYSSKYALSTECKYQNGQKRTGDNVSLDSEVFEDTPLSEIIGVDTESRLKDSNDLMNRLFESLNEEEKIYYTYYLEDATDADIGRQLGFSRSAAGKKRRAFYEMAKKRLSLMQKTFQKLND